VYFFSSNAQKICIKEEARKFVTSLLTRGRTHITTLMLGWEIRVEYLTQLTTRQIDQSVFLLATGIAIRRRVKKKLLLVFISKLLVGEMSEKINMRLSLYAVRIFSYRV